MKILVIGDIHGRYIWKDIVNKELKNNLDEIVFLADYFDAKGTGSSNPQDQINNFLDIVEFKRENKTPVFLLFGNHDYHYHPEVQEQYSGYQKYSAASYTRVISENLEYLQMAHGNDDFLFTHAGVSITFCKDNGIMYDCTSLPDITESIAEDLNDRFIHDPALFGFNTTDSFDFSGDSKWQSPIWIRPQSLGKDIIPGIRQVVGHTTINDITTVEHKTELSGKEYTTGVTLTDALASRQYLIIENGIMRTETI